LQSSNGFYIDTNAKSNLWGILGVQNIDDGGTGANDEYGFDIRCSENTFNTLYIEDVGTAGGTGTSALVKLRGARGNVFTAIRSISHNADYGIFTPSDGSLTINNHFIGLRGFGSGFGVAGVYFDNFTYNNILYEPDDIDPSVSSQYLDLPSKNVFFTSGQRIGDFRDVGNSTSFDATHRQYMNFNTAVTGTFSNITGTAYDSKTVYAYVAASGVTFDFSAGGRNIKGNGGVDYVSSAGDMLTFIYAGGAYHAFISSK